MVLDLEHRGRHAGVGGQVVEELGVEVGDAQGTEETFAIGGGGGAAAAITVLVRVGGEGLFGSRRNERL